MLRFLRHYALIAISFVAFEAMTQTNAWSDIYEVKKKDTIYGIARKYGITIEELIAANPEMKSPGYKLKKGVKVFIPFKTKPKAVAEVKKPVAVNTANMKTQPGKTVKIGVMLPLHNVDGDGKRMVEYYRGILMACDSLRKAGISTDIRAWNVNIDADIKTTLLDESVKNLDIIFGPLYTKQVKDLADYCKKNDIKLVIPFSTSAEDVNTNNHVYQVYQNGIRLNDRAISTFLGRFQDANIVLIDCNDTSSDKGIFTSGLRKQLEERGVSYRITNLESSIGMFQKAFASNMKNVVILNTGRSPELNLVFRKLNELTLIYPSLDISMYGYNEWLQYEGVYRELYHKYDVYVPSTYYYYKGLSRIAQFEQNYKKWFGLELQSQYIPRFALTGYDHAQFFVRGLYQKGGAFEGKKGESTYRPMQTQLQFVNAGDNGGMQNNTFLLVHYNKNRIIETLEY